MPGKVIDPNQNQKERNFGIVYVSDQVDIPEGFYVYEKMKGNKTRGLIFGDIIEVKKSNKKTSFDSHKGLTILGMVVFKKRITDESNAPVINKFREKIGTEEVVENIIEDLIKNGKLDSDFK